MFRDPLRRDPLVIIWAVVMGLSCVVALSNNSEWGGSLEAERVAGFIGDVLYAFLWSYLLLLLAAWLRARVGRTGQRRRREPIATHVPFAALPRTDRWLGDSRSYVGPPQQAAAHELPVRCRHGVALDEPPTGSPVLRALSISHAIVRPGSSVNVTWCFEHARDVVVDGESGHPPCGETLVRIDNSRRVELTARSRAGMASAATATVVALAAPELAAPAPLPPVSLHTDVAATVGGASSITQRLDEFWTTQEQLRPKVAAPAGWVLVPPRLVRVPSTLVRAFRRPSRATEEV